MQAIQTKYLGPTNCREARYKAIAPAGTAIISIDYRLNSDENHAAAAATLARKLGWIGGNYSPLIGGTLPDGSMAWVMSGDLSPSIEVD